MIKFKDVLMKGAIEDFFPDFLRIIFSNADEIFDFSKPIVFLEQELAEITLGVNIKQPKIIDKLAGVYLKTGQKVFVRVHVEVETKAKKGIQQAYVSVFFETD